MNPINMTLGPTTLDRFAETRGPAALTDLNKVQQVASDFESLFASQILKEMRQSLDPETMFGGDSGDVYGGMFDMFIGKQVAEGGGFGLAKMLTETLKQQLGANAAPKV